MADIDVRPDGLETSVEIGLDTEPTGPFHKGDHKRGGENPHSAAADVAGEKLRSDDFFLVAFYS